MKKYISEFLGTFALIFCGTGAMTINEITNGSISHVGVAITWGCIVVAMIYAFGELSGAHFNPVVTVALALYKKVSWREVPRYILIQFLGAFSASLLLRILFPTSLYLGATRSSFDSPWQAFVLELLLTFFLMLTIIRVAVDNVSYREFSGVVIGLVVGLEAMFAGPMTNASMNPIRSLAPAIASGYYQDLWLYILAPFIGGFLAVVCCKLLKKE